MFPFIQTHASILNYNSTVYAQLEALHESCGFREFNERYLTLPPPGTQPTNVVNRTCLGILFLALLAEVDVNPCASVYDIVS